MTLLVLLAACSTPKDTGESAEPVVALGLEELKDPATCQECHPDQYAEWSGSMHAYAAVDPVFLAMNARGQRETDHGLGTFCVNCHAPMAVRDGATTDGLNLADVDPKLLGVTCYTCHAATGVDTDHNNGLTYTDDLTLRAGIDDPLTTGAHGSAHGDLQDRGFADSAALCGSCHDVVTPAGVALERTYAEWKGTQYSSATNGLQQTCGNCHMDGRDAPAADVDGAPVRRVHSHAFPGVDTALIPFPDAERQEAEVQAALDPSLLPALNVCIGGEGAEIELTLENVAAGHSWPSGAAQDRRAWIQVTAYQGDSVVFQAGVVPDGVALADVDDPNRWTFGDQMLGADGEPVHMFWEAATYTSSLLPGRTTGVDTHVRRSWVLGDVVPDRVEATAFIRPIDQDVLQGLVDSGDLDPSIVTAMPTRELANARIAWESLAMPCGI